jgi:autotransporter-associated beta strand protein
VVTKSNSGTIILSGANSYTGWTRIYDGAVQANVGAGVPNQSAADSRRRRLPEQQRRHLHRQIPERSRHQSLPRVGGSGGFAGGGGKMTVNLRNDGSVVNWTGNGDTGIAGNMVLLPPLRNTKSSSRMP